MNFLAIRLVLWLVTLAVFPIPANLVSLSFQVEILQRITLASLSPGDERVQWTERVLSYLAEAEKKEIDPWLRDDLRIAWITTQWANSGVPESSWHSSPHVAATYQVLRCHPDQVWPRIVAERKRKLGAEYDACYDQHGNWRVASEVVASSPKKPCVNERRSDARRNQAAKVAA